jgi:hypothetical protein
MHVASVCFKCFKCSIRILQLFHLDVAYVLQLLHTCFQVFQVILQVFQMYVAFVSAVRMYVASVSSECFKNRSRCSTCCNVPHLPQPPAAVTGTSCMCVRSGEMERCSAAGRGSERRRRQGRKWSTHACGKQGSNTAAADVERRGGTREARGSGAGVEQARVSGHACPSRRPDASSAD